MPYANRAWASTHKTKFKKLSSQQGQSCKTVFQGLKLASAQTLLIPIEALNIFIRPFRSSIKQRTILPQFPLTSNSKFPIKFRSSLSNTII